MPVTMPSEMPGYAVIFSSQLTDNPQGYVAMAEKILELAKGQDGFLYHESIRDEAGKGISISYWRDRAAISEWKQQTEHLTAQLLGREKWYEYYRIQICKLEREYSFARNEVK